MEHYNQILILENFTQSCVMIHNMNTMFFYILNFFSWFHYEKFELMGRCIHPSPFYLSSTSMGNLKGAPLFCNFALRNTQELINTQDSGIDEFSFQTRMQFFLILLGINISIFDLHNTIN